MINDEKDAAGGDDDDVKLLRGMQYIIILYTYFPVYKDSLWEGLFLWHLYIGSA